MSSSRKVSRVPGNGLLRTPQDLSWRLIAALALTLKTELPDSFGADLEACLRARSSSAYHRLRERWGPQCIDTVPGLLERPYAFSSIQLLVMMAKKDRSLETVPPTERRKVCISSVVSLDNQLFNWKPPASDDPIVSRMTADIALLLGRSPDFMAISVGARHGPGTAIGTTYRETSSYFKYSKWPYRCAPAARAMLREVIASDPRWLGALEDSYRERNNIERWRILNWAQFWEEVIQPCNYNRVTSVPKDGTKDRPIAIEPSGNILLQLAIEGALRTRLKAWGCDLDDQEPNRLLAFKGSTDKTPLSPATLDLSNASDTISRELVRVLLPPEWFAMLDAVRSPYGLLPDGTALAYAKMSSMGNGYTFALESLVFMAMIRAIVHECGHPSDLANCRVFGDDLIYPSYLTRIVKSYVRRLGFMVNDSKSFTAGPFRESCGADYVNGHYCRPVFIPETGLVDAKALLSVRNQLHRWFALVYGCQIPLVVDNLLLGYLRSLDLGPESSTNFDGWVHVFSRNPMPVVELRWRPRRLPGGRLFLFRKLMHSLRVTTGVFGSFVVSERGTRGLLRARTRVIGDYYVAPGLPIQDHERPTWESIRNALPPDEG